MKNTHLEFHQFFKKPTAFEGHYNTIREKEGRILSLEQIRQLPKTPGHYQHHQEWNKRIRSTARFLKYLSKHEVQSMLDVGCGNGWLMYKTAPLVSELTGLDINKLELEQAANVLTDCDNVTLTYGDLFKIDTAPVYDLVLFNASVQYFPDLGQLLKRVRLFLKPKGEVHILDSPFYNDEQTAQAAKRRTQAYYENNGVGEMADFYHHHTFQDLSAFDYKVLYDPHSLIQKFKRKLMTDIPLYWISIKFD